MSKELCTALRNNNCNNNETLTPIQQNMRKCILTYDDSSCAVCISLSDRSSILQTARGLKSSLRITSSLDVYIWINNDTIVTPPSSLCAKKWTKNIFQLIVSVKKYWKDWKLRCSMVRWWKRDGTITRWLKHGDTMMKTRWCDGISSFHHRTIVISPLYHRVFTIVPSHFPHRAIEFSPSKHRVFIIVPSPSGCHEQWYIKMDAFIMLYY